MYLVTIHVPIHVDGDRLLLGTDWKRSVLLLRDSLAGRLGPLTVLAPSLPADATDGTQPLEPVLAAEGVRLVPSFDVRCRARRYWTRERGRWVADVRRLVAGARVVHAGVNDVYRPICFEGIREAVRQGKASVFVEDTDVVFAVRQAAAGASLARRLERRAYAEAYEGMGRWAVRRADLSLLKGDAVMRRYAPHARNPRSFVDTSYRTADVLPSDVLERRLAHLAPGAPLRLVYCGRLVERKGLLRALAMIREAVGRGADLRFDVIGDGPQRPELEAAIAAPPLAGRVRLLGAAPYGPALLEQLRAYDALLFTSTLEETPRMIFDGYAAGLPLVSTDIPFVKERARADGAVLALDGRDDAGSVARLVELWRRPEALADLARSARAAALENSADVWYRRRAEWTLEAVARREGRAAGALAPGSP